MIRRKREREENLTDAKRLLQQEELYENGIQGDCDQEKQHSRKQFLLREVVTFRMTFDIVSFNDRKS